MLYSQYFCIELYKSTFKLNSHLAQNLLLVVLNTGKRLEGILSPKIDPWNNSVLPSISARISAMVRGLNFPAVPAADIVIRFLGCFLTVDTAF